MTSSTSTSTTSTQRPEPHEVIAKVNEARDAHEAKVEKIRNALNGEIARLDAAAKKDDEDYLARKKDRSIKRKELQDKLKQEMDEARRQYMIALHPFQEEAEAANREVESFFEGMSILFSSPKGNVEGFQAVRVGKKEESGTEEEWNEARESDKQEKKSPAAAATTPTKTEPPSSVVKNSTATVKTTSGDGVVRAKEQTSENPAANPTTPTQINLLSPIKSLSTMNKVERGDGVREETSNSHARRLKSEEVEDAHYDDASKKRGEAAIVTSTPFKFSSLSMMANKQKERTIGETNKDREDDYNDDEEEAPAPAPTQTPPALSSSSTQATSMYSSQKEKRRVSNDGVKEEKEDDEFVSPKSSTTTVRRSSKRITITKRTKERKPIKTRRKQDDEEDDDDGDGATTEEEGDNGEKPAPNLSVAVSSAPKDLDALFEGFINDRGTKWSSLAEAFEQKRNENVTSVSDLYARELGRSTSCKSCGTKMEESCYVGLVGESKERRCKSHKFCGKCGEYIRARFEEKCPGKFWFNCA